MTSKKAGGQTFCLCVETRVRAEHVCNLRIAVYILHFNIMAHFIQDVAFKSVASLPLPHALFTFETSRRRVARAHPPRSQLNSSAPSEHPRTDRPPRPPPRARPSRTARPAAPAPPRRPRDADAPRELPSLAAEGRGPTAAFFTLDSWAEVGADKEVITALAALGVSRPSHIQGAAFRAAATAAPHLALADHAGSGKTLAYLLPLLQALKRREKKEGGPVGRAGAPNIVILAPTAGKNKMRLGFYL
jgi:hypothetical protein